MTQQQSSENMDALAVIRLMPVHIRWIVFGYIGAVILISLLYGWFSGSSPLSLASTFAFTLFAAFMGFPVAYFVLAMLYSPRSEQWSPDRWAVAILLLGGALVLAVHLVGIFLSGVLIVVLFIGSFLQRARHGYLPPFVVPVTHAMPGTTGEGATVTPPLPPASAWVAWDSPAISFRYPGGMAPAGRPEGEHADQGNLTFQSATDILTVSWSRSEKGPASTQEYQGLVRDSVTALLGKPPRPDAVAGEIEWGLQDRHVMGVIPVEFRTIGETTPSMTAMAVRWYCQETSRYHTVRLVTRNSRDYARHLMKEILLTLRCHGPTIRGPASR